MKRKKRHERMKQQRDSRSQIIELGKQLGLDPGQVYSLLNEPCNAYESVSFSLGPPHYPGGFYGSISINDFHIVRK